LAYLSESGLFNGLRRKKKIKISDCFRFLAGHLARRGFDPACGSACIDSDFRKDFAQHRIAGDLATAIPSSREGPPSRSAVKAVAHELHRKTMRVTDHGEVP
jgi:hypothetical protein